jgi:hypothetical protein
MDNPEQFIMNDALTRISELKIYSEPLSTQNKQNVLFVKFSLLGLLTKCVREKHPLSFNHFPIYDNGEDAIFHRLKLYSGDGTDEEYKKAIEQLEISFVSNTAVDLGWFSSLIHSPEIRGNVQELKSKIPKVFESFYQEGIKKVQAS